MYKLSSLILIVPGDTYECVTSLVRLCLPLPPTPSSRALPRGSQMMREMQQTWKMASRKRTSFIWATFTWL